MPLCNVAGLSTDRILELVNEIIQRRGYLVINTGGEVALGHIYSGVGTLVKDDFVSQPFKVMGATGSDDWNEQQALALSLCPEIGPTDLWGPFFYRIATD